MKKGFFKFSLCILCSCIGLVGCINNDTIIDKEKGKTETAYFTFSIDAGELKSETRAIEDEGLEFEYAVSNVYVMLYKVSSGENAYTFDLDVTNIGTVGGQMAGSDVYDAKNPTTRRFVSVAKEVETNDYYIVALANVSPKIKELIDAKANIKTLENAVYSFNGTDFTQLIGDPNYRYEDGYDTGDYSFLMSNFKIGQSVAKEKLKLTAEEAVEDPVEVLIDRVVAKVTVDASNISVKNGTAGDYGWKADIINKKMYWIRHAAARHDGTWEIMSHTNRRYIYGQDPNFDGFSHFTNPSLTGNLNDEFLYINSVDYSDKCDWEYITENTIEPTEGFDVVTRVILKFNLIPDGFSANESYFWYKGVAVKVSDMQGYYDDPASLEGITALNGLRTVIEEYKLLPSAKFDDLKTNAKIELTYYEEGASYYSIPIRHFLKEDLASNNYGKYGVVRNNEYIIKLGAFTGPGEPDLPPPGPETTYLSADIHIQNWFVREQEYEN